MSGLDISLSGDAEMLVIDGAGRRTGFVNSSTEDLKEIPNSSYFRDSIADNETGKEVTGVTRSLNIFRPGAGNYTVIITGTGPGTYTLTVDPFSNDGNSQPLVSAQGITGVGSTTSFSAQFDPVPGATPVLTQTTPIPKVGDLNLDGTVDCADMAIVKASFGKKCSQTGYDARADLNNDCVVDVRDLAIVSQKLPAGTRCP